MGILSSALKASVQRVRDRTFSTNIEVLMRQTTPNGAGGETTDWVVTATHLGRLRHSRQMDYLRLNGGEEVPEGAWIVTVPLDATIGTADRLRANGKTFTIIGADTGRTDPLVQTLFCMLAADL